MKKNVLFFFISIFLPTFFGIQISFCQSPLVRQWDYRFGGSDDDRLFIIQQTTDGGFILGGTSGSGVSGNKSGINWGYTDYWIVKTDSNGIKQWDRTFGGSGVDNLFSVEQTPDGGYLLGGESESGISGNKSNPTWGSFDYWIVKTDSVGNKLWDIDVGGISDDHLYSVHQTFDNGYIVAGYSASGISGEKTQPSWGFYDYWIIKMDSLFNIQWDKDFGGASSDFLYDAHQTADGGFILGGRSLSGNSGNKSQNNWGNGDYWIVKLDAFGNKQWDQDYGSTDDDFLFSLLQTPDQGYILGGNSLSGIAGNKTQNTQGGWDYWIVKTDSLGNKQWDRDFGGTSNEDEFGNIVLTTDSGYLITGSSYSPASGDKSENNMGLEQTWIIKTDTSGIKQWDKTILSPGQDEFCLTIQTKDGCFVTASQGNGGTGGYKTQPAWNFSYDYWLIKFCDSTHIVTPKSYLESSDTIFCENKCIDFYDHSINNATSWLWLFPGSVSLTSSMQNPTGICYGTYGNFDVTLIACNVAGCDTLFLPGFIKNQQNPPVPTITLIGDSLCCTPAYSYQWYFNSAIIPGATSQIYQFQQTGIYYVIISDSYGCTSASNGVYTGIHEADGDNSSIYVIPNPTDGNFILYGAPVNSIFKIFDVEGRIIYSDKIKSSKENLQLKANDGIYFIEIKSGNKMIRKKIIVQN